LLKYNCIEGVKVTTTGNPSSGDREDSSTCRIEREDGYITILSIGNDRVKIGLKHVWATYFNYNQIKKYEGDLNA
jgi:hypothetical protein